MLKPNFQYGMLLVIRVSGQLNRTNMVPLKQRSNDRTFGEFQVKHIIAATAALGIAGLAFMLLSGQDGPQTADAALPLKKPATLKPIFDSGLAKQAHAFTMSEPVEQKVVDVKVKRGDTLIGLLTRHGVERRNAHAAITKLSEVYDVRRLQIGQPISLKFQPLGGSEGNIFQGLSFRPDVDRDVHVELSSAGDFEAKEKKRALNRYDGYATATIQTSLYNAAVKSDMPLDVLMDLVRIFGFDVDFQRDIQSGDRFEVLYDHFTDDVGNPVRNGEIIYASMTLSGKRLDYYLYTPKSGYADYFNPKGQSVRKTLMRTPINGARLSSRYGKRKHPILGYTKMHRGVDFAAPRGTPIMAAGDGVIEKAGRFGAYGKYLRIRHNGSIKTAYAHLKGYKRGIRVGKRVKQGDIVGYVGSTGRSTGPHLHYEVLVEGRQVNPLSVKLPAGEKLKGKDLKNFQAMLRKIDNRVIAARPVQLLAQD